MVYTLGYNRRNKKWRGEARKTLQGKLQIKTIWVENQSDAWSELWRLVKTAV